MSALMSAILTALYHKGQGLLTQEVLEALPSQVFGGLDPAKQQRKVSDACDACDACDALAASGAIEKMKSGNANCWRLLPSLAQS